MFNWLRNLFRQPKCEICGSPGRFIKADIHIDLFDGKIEITEESIRLCGLCLKESIELDQAELNQ